MTPWPPSIAPAGMGPIPWLLLGELLPTRERGAVSGTVTALNNGCAFLVVLSFQWLNKLLRAGNVFFLYAALCASASIFSAALLPETKGHTLEEIEQIFAGDGDGGLEHGEQKSGKGGKAGGAGGDEGARRRGGGDGDASRA